REAREPFRLALHLDVAAVLRDDAVADRQAEPRAAAHGLRREERLEDLRADRGGHAGPVVLDDEHERIVLAARGRADRASPLRVLDRLLGVDEEVQEDLLEL